ncbi:hypothetical protein J1N35_032235 [Gossypium stocksii]|uniref:Uncharacterized protein n=1 Tax=Gossypium stocksii TaxID=47602 RepID=A0A9D3V2W3_9ROSI|nr:hypothetical protein J1N35_032235 [Gossypium stocksii]
MLLSFFDHIARLPKNLVNSTAMTPRSPTNGRQKLSHPREFVEIPRKSMMQTECKSSFALSNQGRSPALPADKINVVYRKLPMVAKSGLTKLVALHIVIGPQSEISVPLRR